MQIRVADYIADFLVVNNIKHVFTVTGGGAMHLNDAFGHNPGLKCVYNHHEQACAIAAESYARVNREIAAVCVTTGPGGTNAITGVVGGFTDSIPMIVISGQVKYSTTARSTGLPIRALGDQEFDIVKAVSCMTKYAVMVIDPNEIRFHLEKALFLAKNGRPGPCWIDVPVNVQGAMVETDEMQGYDPSDDDVTENPKLADGICEEILKKIDEAKRPVIYAGSSIIMAGAKREFLELVDKLDIPVVTSWNSIDAIDDAHPLYTGRAGIMGDRAGNFAVQGSDLVLSLGCRQSIRQVGYNWEDWARNAYTIVNDIDLNELKKPTVRIDMPVHANVNDLIHGLNTLTQRRTGNAEWKQRCLEWKEKYPVIRREFYSCTNQTNPYCFVKELSSRLPEGQITVVGNGSACVMGSHGYEIKKDQRFIINSGIASMGYDLPAAIGACYASDMADIICITGDGSIQMNLQEFQTIVHNKRPIKIFIINHNGYHSIRQTQRAFFGEPLVGIGPESGDLSFPDMEKIAWAYGIPFKRCTCNDELQDTIEATLQFKGCMICEIISDSTQNFEPKASSKRLDDGTMVSAPLDDLAPFLCREEYNSNIYCKGDQQ